MKSLRAQTIPLIAALLAVPALAQERWQIGVGLNFHPSETVAPASTSTRSGSLRRAEKIVPAIHAGYRFHDFAGSNLSATGEWQFRSSFRVSGVGNTIAGGRVTSVGISDRYHSSFIAPGIQWNFHRDLDFGFGLQYRFTRLASDQLSVNTRYDRPWLLSYVGYTFKEGEVMRPYVTLRLAATPMTTRAPSFTAGRNGERDLLRSMAGNLEVSLQAGVRF